VEKSPTIHNLSVESIGRYRRNRDVLNFLLKAVLSYEVLKELLKMAGFKD